MDEKVWLAILTVGLLLLGLFLVEQYCSGVSYMPGGSGNLMMVCLFPRPWSDLFGARPTYVFNVFVMAGLPLVIFLLAWVWNMTGSGR